MKRKITLVLSAAIFSFSISAQLITNHNTITQPAVAQPAVGVPFIDPRFNSTVIRITNAKESGIPGVFPDYSKHQAWNADESLMMLRSGNGDVHIYNGVTYQYIKTFPSSVSGVQDIYWHPTNPQLLYYAMDNTFNIINELTDEVTVLHTFPEYATVTTRAEGNMSNDGRYIALCGYDTIWTPIDFLVYDLVLDSVISSLDVRTHVTEFDWISISPLGNHVVVDYADKIVGRYHGVEVYDRQFNLVWQKPLGSGHSDMGLDSDGTEVLIMDVYDDDLNVYYIKKFGLSDSSSITLLTLSQEYDMHESCRSMSRPGWVYVSTFDFVGRLTDDDATWLPFEDEIFALNMDTPGKVERLAHHHSRRYSPTAFDSGNSIYESEPHATPNRTGTRILFGSNWRINIDSISSVDAYICNVGSLITSSENILPENQNGIKISPNPFKTETTISCNFDLTHANITVYNILGQSIKSRINRSGQHATIDRGDMAAGIYYLKVLHNNKSTATGKLIAQ